MSEWFKEHAWKLTPAARADGHEIPPTHFPSTTSHNNDVYRHIPVSDGICPRFRGVCNTVLTQFSDLLAPVRLDLRPYASIGADTNYSHFTRHRSRRLRKHDDREADGEHGGNRRHDDTFYATAG